MSKLGLAKMANTTKLISVLGFAKNTIICVSLLLFPLLSFASDHASSTDIEADEQTFETLKIIASKGNATAQRMIASMYEQGDGVSKDIGKAIEWYRKAAEHDDDIAQFYLGYLYYQAIGLKQDYKKAFVWFSKAAKQGNADFQYNLGNLYRYGEGTSVNLDNALKWYRLAASQDQSNAQFDLASLHEDGLHIKKSLVNAFVWYSLAAEQIDTSDELKALTGKMSKEQITKAQTKTQEWIANNRRDIN